MATKLWDRIQRGMEEGFDAALDGVRRITDKAGEGIELTRLRREKARLGNQLTRELAALGNTVFEKVSHERLTDVAEKLNIHDQIVHIASDEAKMIDIDKKINKEIKADQKRSK
jgi:hypothetical protein